MSCYVAIIALLLLFQMVCISVYSYTLSFAISLRIAYYNVMFHGASNETVYETSLVLMYVK